MELLKKDITENSTVTLEVKVTKEEFDKANDKAFAQKAKTMNIPGFRKGKAPRSVIEKMYGAGIFFEEAVNLCYPEAFKLAIKEADIKPIGPADIDLTPITEEGFTFKIIVPVYPEMTLTSYKGIAVEKEEVTKADAASIKAELEGMAKKLSRIETVTRKIKKGDIVNFDFEGSVDGTPFPGGKADGFDLEIGSGHFIPGFEEALIGSKTDEEKDVEVTFPEDYHSADLAGKPAVFKCKINMVKQTITPKIDDEFAKDVSEFETLEDLKKDVSAKIVTRLQDTANRACEEKLLDVLSENLEGEIPQIMLEQQADRVVEDFAYRIQMQGMNIDDYLKMNSLDMPAFRKLFAPQAEKQVRIRLALEVVANTEKLEVTDADIDAEFTKMAESYNMPIEQIKKSVPADALKGDLMMNKAVEFVRENAKITKAKKTAKKATKKDEEVSE